LLAMLMIRSDTRFSGLDQDVLVGALGFAPGGLLRPRKSRNVK
jgi:hypothetical protein